MLRGLEPNPSLAVNLRWEMLAANDAMTAFFDGVPPSLLAPPVNVLRATLHPDGLARRIVNFAQWRDHVLRRVRRQLARTGAPDLAVLLDELASYPAPDHEPAGDPADPGDDLVIPLRLATEFGELALLYSTTVFGAPRDVTLDEIAVETFFPADAATADVLRGLAAAR